MQMLVLRPPLTHALIVTSTGLQREEPIEIIYFRRRCPLMLMDMTYSYAKLQLYILLLSAICCIDHRTYTYNTADEANTIISRFSGISPILPLLRISEVLTGCHFYLPFFLIFIRFMPYRWIVILHSLLPSLYAPLMMTDCHFRKYILVYISFI